MRYAEGPAAAEDVALERWIDWTMASIGWHEERAEALGWEGIMDGNGVARALGEELGREQLAQDTPRVTEAEKREALGTAAALEVAEVEAMAYTTAGNGLEEDEPDDGLTLIAGVLYDEDGYEAEDDEPGIVYSWTEPCGQCGEIHPI